VSIEDMKLKLHTFVRGLRNRKVVFYSISMIVILLFILAQMIYHTYIVNRNIIIDQQLQHLLSISKATSRSLEVFASEKSDSLKILALNREIGSGMKNESNTSVQAALTAFAGAEGNDIARVYQIDKTGRIIYRYPDADRESALDYDKLLEEDIENVIKSKTSYISEVRKDKDGKLKIFMFEPVFLDGEFEGVIAASISMETIYEKIVKQVKVGQKGYAMVKDEKGIILMHPAEDQIGIDVIETRKQLYPDFDLKELEKLIKQQYTNEEGTVVYYSYWWTDEKMQKTKKLNAFSRAHLGEHFWVVAMVMSYEEVEIPLRENLIKIIEIFAVIILILVSFIFIILKIQENKEALEVETKYLKELNAAMEKLRKKDLQLQHSHKLQVVGTLTGGIAHEFNNLLTPILGYSEILKNRTDAGSETYEYINEIYEASNKAKEIIERILVFSRSDNGSSKYVPVEIGQIVDETLSLVKSTITPNVRVVFEEKGDTGCIMANRVQIHQVIFNLCTNAYHSMKYSGGVLKVTLDTVEGKEIQELSKYPQHAESYVSITVGDTGYGMSKETVEKIFDPFFTTKPTGEGTGLGLFIVQGIIENHKGFITVESEIGRGSTFKVYFPKIQGKPEETEQKEKSNKKQTRSVLLVDDEPKVLNVMKKGLEQFGFKVITEGQGVEALKLFSRNPGRFDVAVIDQNMPYIKGTELAERLKMIDPQLRIIIATGFVEEKVLEALDRMIIDEYIAKPVTGEQLAEAIRRVFENEV